MIAKAFTGRQARLSVVAKASGSKAIKTGKTVKVAPKPSSSGSLAILLKIQELGLLSKVEELGVLSKLEDAGFTLSKIESSGLLSTLEKSGVLSLVADKNTPGLLNFTGLALLGAAVALVYVVPDDTTSAVVAQGLGAVLLALGGVGALTGGNILGQVQKL